VDKKVYVKTYGCQMNVYDSHRMADTLAPAGFSETAHPEDADLVILNTCHIREKAAEKVFSELGRLRLLKDARGAAGGRMMIAVAGWRIWRLRGAREPALLAWAVQLGLNLGWSFLFFGACLIGAALIEIVALLAAIVVTARLFWRIDRGAALLLAPYGAWVAYATLLNAALWRLN